MFLLQACNSRLSLQWERLPVQLEEEVQRGIESTEEWDHILLMYQMMYVSYDVRASDVSSYFYHSAIALIIPPYSNQNWHYCWLLHTPACISFLVSACWEVDQKNQTFAYKQMHQDYGDVQLTLVGGVRGFSYHEMNLGKMPILWPRNVFPLSLAQQYGTLPIHYKVLYQCNNCSVVAAVNKGSARDTMQLSCTCFASFGFSFPTTILNNLVCEHIYSRVG